jgi:hypothetical protein
VFWFGLTDWESGIASQGLGEPYGPEKWWCHVGWRHQVDTRGQWPGKLSKGGKAALCNPQRDFVRTVGVGRLELCGYLGPTIITNGQGKYPGLS